MKPILVCDTTGSPNHWGTYKQYAYYKSREIIHWELGECVGTLYGGIQRITGKQSTMEVQAIIAVKGDKCFSKNRARYNSPALTNKGLFLRDRRLCAYCGVRYTHNALTRDHVFPRSKGGKDTWTNCVTACKRCNRQKGNRTLDNCNMELLYVPYSPNRAEYLILQNRVITGDQMDFLLSYVTPSRKNNYI